MSQNELHLTAAADKVSPEHQIKRVKTKYDQGSENETVFMGDVKP